MGLLFNSTQAAERPWQQIVDPRATEVANHFDNPPPEYGLSLLWGWNGDVNEKVIMADLDTIRSRNIRVVTIEAGYEMPDPYLSKGWFERIKMAVDEAEKRDMRVWLIDEGKYPSGFAGGKFSRERPDLRMQGLDVAERIQVTFGQTLSRKLPPEIVSAVAVNQADTTSQVIDVRSGVLNWTAPGGQWEVMLVDHQFRTAITRAANNPTRGKDATNSLCDYLNPAATRQFIAFTHAQYERYCGDAFGRTILGFRGDEPDYAHLPWTPGIVELFEKDKGYDVRPYLASFLLRDETVAEAVRRAKADYWDIWSNLFAENFFKIQADWCADRHLEYMVHLNNEHRMSRLVRSTGDFFRPMRHVQVPGVDAIWNQVWPGNVADFVKLASSAAHVFGRPRALSESFAAYRVRPNAALGKWAIDYQLVRGINLIEVMYYPASSSGRRRRGWLVSEEFPDVVEYVNRASYLLSIGRPTARIALYFPTTSLWLGDGAADTHVWEITQELLEAQRDFDFVDEQALSSVLSHKDGTLENLSGQRYQTVLIPSIHVISKAALSRLKEFSEAGGQVVFLGDTPPLVVDKTFAEAETTEDFSWAVRSASGELTDDVLLALPKPDVVLDRPCPPVKVLHRRWADADLYFFFNESVNAQSRNVVLAGSGQVQVWDAETGGVEAVEGASVNRDNINMRLRLGPYDSKFVVVGAQLPNPTPKSEE